MLVEIIGRFPFSIWEQYGVVLWSFGGGGIDSCKVVVWTNSTGWTGGKWKDSLVMTIWTDGGRGGIGHWLAPEEGLASKLPHPPVLGCIGDSGMFTIPRWGCKPTFGVAWGCGKAF